MPIHARWKGKKRAMQTNDRDDGTGGESGIVLSLEQVNTGAYDVLYTLPVKVGAKNQEFSLQIDTGSSDLWIASTSCYTSSCSSAKGHLYNPNAAIPTNRTFEISYFSGSASGPIVWDSVSLGDYTIDHQALAAVTDVKDEPLAPNFTGILGLAPPPNSVIAYDLPLTSNSPNGATWVSNLFSANTAPSSRFFSLALSRPGSNQVPAVLGIGQHPTTLVPDPSLVQYSAPVDGDEAAYWRAAVTAITVYDNGVAKQVQLGSLNAILDSGTALIFTTTTIANGIYGSIGIEPASNGIYYVPCTTPLNMTITLDDRSATPLHPLDLTTEPSQGNQFCTGLIQTTESPDSEVDMILGVPFMRNVYTVMAYSVPSSNGSFTAVNGSDLTDGGISHTITPMLGLLSLTDPTTALQEFHNVRVLNQSISGGTTTNHSASMVELGGKQVSVGLVVLIGVLSFFALCGVLFAIRWFLSRWERRKAAAREMDPSGDDNSKVIQYMLTRTSSSRKEKAVGMDSHGGLSEDELRSMRFEAYMQKNRTSLYSTKSSGQTKVGGYEGADYGRVYDDMDMEGREFGLRNLRKNVPPVEEGVEVWDPATGLDWGDSTLTQQVPPKPPEGGRVHLRNEREELTASHRRNSSLAMQPLLASQSRRENDFDVDEYDGYTRYFLPDQRHFQPFMIAKD